MDKRFVGNALLVLLGLGNLAAAQAASPAFDVVRYELAIAPDLASKTVTGIERIELDVLQPGLTRLAFDAGTLSVDDAGLDGRPVRFRREGNQLVLEFDRPVAGRGHRLALRYHGSPTHGISFFPESEQIYTVFSTSQWMVCVDDPSERATFDVDVTVPAGWEVVANGSDAGELDAGGNRVTHRFRLDRAVPSYTYGFAAGRFRRVDDHTARVPLVTVVPQDWTADLARRVLRETADMFRFFESRAGVAYPDASYTQVLADGNPQQEMSGFSLLPAAWGRRVLSGESDVGLAAHELAHQWWGNHVTNAAWTHFWLNEGMATFMAAAYIEQRSGRETYERIIAEYRASYDEVRARGHDKPLEFPDWRHPSADDRTLVYRKGAYVLHLLREELGEAAFWAGLKAYTQQFAGRSVASADFQKAMEQASGRDLSAFFARWVRR